MEQMTSETTRDSVSDSGSDDLDHDDDSLDSEKALNLAMAEEAYQNSTGNTLQQTLSMNCPTSKVTGFGGFARGPLAPTTKGLHSAFTGSLSPPRAAAAPLSTTATSLTSTSITNTAAALAAATAGGASSSLPMNPLAQV